MGKKKSIEMRWVLNQQKEKRKQTRKKKVKTHTHTKENSI